MHSETLDKDIFTFAVRMNYGYEYVHPNRMNLLSACKASSAISSLTLLSYSYAQNGLGISVCHPNNTHILVCLLCKLWLFFEELFLLKDSEGSCSPLAVYCNIHHVPI